MFNILSASVKIFIITIEWQVFNLLLIKYRTYEPLREINKITKSKTISYEDLDKTCVKKYREDP